MPPVNRYRRLIVRPALAYIGVRTMGKHGHGGRYAPHPAYGWWERCANEMQSVYDGIVHMCEGAG